MNRELLKRVIFDQHDIIRSASIVPRRYRLDPNANYVISGLRRAGKSTMLYEVAQDLAASGVEWERIIYINFEDERLLEFSVGDFQDILLVQSELSDKPGYFFFDEIQNVAGWEKFARRMADMGERVYITGSNAKMLSSQIATTLGGRYFSLRVSPYRFDEYLDACGQPHTGRALNTTREIGKISRLFNSFCQNGGLPESLRYESARPYVENVYHQVLLGDIAAREQIRNTAALRALIKKVAETVRNDVSFSALHNTLKSIGYAVGKDTVISYLQYAKDAYLLFTISNAANKFVDRESNPKYYFSDNGLLNLMVYDRNTALLENVVAIALHDAYGEDLYYLKSTRHDIDLDFYVPGQKLAVQVAYSIAGQAHSREVKALLKLNGLHEDLRLVIVTMSEEETIDDEGCAIEVVPAWRFLLQLASVGGFGSNTATTLSPN